MLPLRRILRIDLALHFVWKSTPGWTILSLIFVVIQGILPLISLLLMKLAVDAVTDGLVAPEPSETFDDVALLILAMGGLAVFSSLIGLFSSWVREAQSMAVGDYMQDIVHAKSITADLEYYENPQYHDTLRRAQAEAPYRPLQILQGLMQLVQNGISLVAVAGLVIAVDPLIALVLLVGVAPGFVVRIAFSGVTYRWQRSRTETERLTSYYSWMLTGDHFAKEIRLFGLGPLFMDRFRNLRARLRGERLQLAARRSAADLLASTLATVAMYSAFAYIAYRTLQGRFSLGDLVMYFQAFQRGQGFLSSFLGSLASLYESSLFLTNLYEFLDLEPHVVDPASPRPVPRPVQMGITFEDVHFRYPDSADEALCGVSLCIGPGEKIALVGPNGSGKTTIVKLLCRLYDPAVGRITLDGADLREFGVTALRREMGIILQDYAHYNLSASENIWLGAADLPPDETRVTEAARRSGADAKLSGLKHGYETVLGRLFQDGEELSIGEWQKVALARAFYRDAQLIILDEPTSSMDAQAEYEVFSRLKDLAEGRMVVLISHRFSTVRMADRIYVLEDGQIAECGSHDELMVRRGTYARLFETQAERYR